MIQAVNRALDILEYVALQNRWVQLKEIADTLSLNHSTCANLVKTLLERSYLQKAKGQRGYKIGDAIETHFLEDQERLPQKLVEAAQPIMKQLSEHLQEGCILTLLEGENRLIIHEQIATNELQVVNFKEKHAYQSSTGRLLLAQLTDAELQGFINEYGLPSGGSWPEVRDKNELLFELNKIRKRGYAQQTSKAYVTGYAMLVTWRQIKTALGVYLPQSRLSPEIERNILDSMAEAAQKIERSLTVR